uniref:Suppressor protein SRP40-like n=1 Tax=Caenorhabditis tropicalis TaxID=1561998 RepID=A0A1I7UY55_9PELO
MTESSVTFSVLIDNEGRIKISLDDSRKTKVMRNSETSHRLSPCQSLESFDSEFLAAGIRRRTVSSSNVSLDTESIVSNDGSSVTHSSASDVCDEDMDRLSDVSFTSCVSRVSATSVLTKSSQETVTSAACYRKQESEQYVRRRRGSKTYEEKIKKDMEDGPSPNVTKYPSVNTTGKMSNIEFNNSNISKSRIPSLKSRPSYVSPNAKCFVPSETADNFNRSYASVISTSPNRSIHSKNDSKSSNDYKKAFKMRIDTDSEGNMRVHFSNELSEESWAIGGVQGSAQHLDVHKI